MNSDRIKRLSLDEIEPALRVELEPTVARLGYFGEFFQVFGAIPGAVIAFMSYTKAVKAPLADNENEVFNLAKENNEMNDPHSLNGKADKK